MDKKHYDLVVIGGGSGGVRAARFAANAGLSVAIVEASRWGGTCVNVGCVPKKLYAHAAHYREWFEGARGFGWSRQSGTHDWSLLKNGTDEYIARLNGIYANLLTNSGVELYAGFAHFVSEHEVLVDQITLSGKHFLIATGSKAVKPRLPGIELAGDSNTFFQWAQRPNTVVIVGGGYIGVELACILDGLGSCVHLIHRGDMPLRGFDQDIRERLTKHLDDSTIDLRLNTEIQSITQGDERKIVHLSNQSKLEVDEIIFATGRKPNTDGLNLTAAGVTLSTSGAIHVDDQFRTNVPHIFAVGDVIDRMQLTPVALAEAMAVVGHLSQNERQPLDYSLVPTAVFCSPNVGTVGLTEKTAIDRGHQITIYESSFRPLHHSLPKNTDRVYMKMIVDADDDRVLGCHMLGENAGELIQGLAVALQSGATKGHFDRTIGIHPTMAEEWVTMRTPREK